MTYRILVTDEIDADGVALLQAEPTFQVDVVPTLPPAELQERIGEYDAFIGRSATRVNAELLRRANRLRVVGRAGVGVDNIALDTATSMGIAVINAPAGNTIAVAELFFGTLIGLLRHVPHAASSMHDGRWDRSKLLGSEIKGRTLVIVGVGRIGSEVATRAHAFGMDVAGYDPYVGDERFRALRVRRLATLDEAVDAADVLTVHTPLTDETLGMIGKRELARMKSGAIVMNLARGGIIEETALLQALESGKLRGAIVDAFTKEPLARTIRCARRRTRCSRRTSAPPRRRRSATSPSTCARRVRDALLHGELSRSINVAGAGTGDWKELQHALQVVRSAAVVARAILADRGVKMAQRLSLRVGPELAGAAPALLASAAAGVLEGTIDVERLNLINARSIAEARGIELSHDGVGRARASGRDARERERGRAADGGGRRGARRRAGAAHPHRRLPHRRRAARGAHHPHEQRRARRDRARRHAARRPRREHRRVPPGAARAGGRGAGGDQRGRHACRAGVRDELLELAGRLHGDGRALPRRVMTQVAASAIERDEGVRRAYAADASGLVMVPEGVARPTSAAEVVGAARRGERQRAPP